MRYNLTRELRLGLYLFVAKDFRKRSKILSYYITNAADGVIAIARFAAGGKAERTGFGCFK